MNRLIALLSLFLVAGCQDAFDVIDKVVFTPSDDLKKVTATLFLTKNVKSSLSGSFKADQYGQFFLKPYQSSSKRMQLGFELKRSITDDLDMGRSTPTTVLANGIPIGLSYGLVEITSPQPINDKFEMYGYVDVLYGSWLGVAALSKVMDEESFPRGTTVSEVHLFDPQGRPGAIVSLFGPEVDRDQTVKRAGGLSMFVNVRQLIDTLEKGPKDIVLRPIK